MLITKCSGLTVRDAALIHKYRRLSRRQSLKRGWTQYINVTFPFTDSVGRMVYVMHGPYVKVSNCRFIESSKNGLKLSLLINNTEKIVSVVTNHRDIGARSSYLGFGGYAKMEDRHQIVRFGLGDAACPQTD